MFLAMGRKQAWDRLHILLPLSPLARASARIRSHEGTLSTSEDHPSAGIAKRSPKSQKADSVYGEDVRTPPFSQKDPASGSQKSMLKHSCGETATVRDSERHVQMDCQ